MLNLKAELDEEAAAEISSRSRMINGAQIRIPIGEVVFTFNC